ncbi:Aste57867_9408 [Aphanomyces stellatus]|uniref:Ribonuclease H n=1 Tax=Aphanomyces stellatus TaxID=120398 RepID=A0A485KN86_9STRA|nr:hypothetical protein As57867_009372 [Aphanomyces stellatus]VFT86288.1 Aste57867_9408 [Aphanomyces stellatus]
MIHLFSYGLKNEFSILRPTAMSFYAVAAGWTCGIFTSWDGGAKEQVTGFPAAKFKKFKSRSEADAFIAQHVVSHKRAREDSGNDTQPPAIRARTTPPTTAPSGAPPTQLGSSYYVVLSGHSTGVFGSWQEAEAAVVDCPNALFRKFPTKAEANAYWTGAQDKPTTLLGLMASTATAPRRSSVDAAPIYDVSKGQRVAEKTSTAASSARPSPSTRPTAATSHQDDAKPVKYYAVAKGRNGANGIFTNWKEAEALVKDFFSAKYKSFMTRAEAEAFLATHEAATSRQPGDPDPKNPASLVAFCDGSAIGNGKARCKAAFACVFPHNETWNVAGKLPSNQATNNRAEYLAALEALKRANVEDPQQAAPLFIFSDSMLLIRSMTEWLPTWQKNQWRKADGEPVKNVDLLQQLTATRGARRVLWQHVKAHTNRRDWKSIWNDKVDQLARTTALS